MGASVGNRGVIVGRIKPGSEAEVARIFAESDATELPDLVGVISRGLYVLGDLYIHVIETAAPFGESVQRVQGHPLFENVRERLDPHIEPYDPDTWRSPKDAFARQFYAWERPGRDSNKRPVSPPLETTDAVVVVDRAGVPEMTSRGGVIRVLVTPARAGARHHIFGEAVLERGEAIADHVHDYGEESIFVVSGTGLMRAGNQEVPMVPGRAVFTPRGMTHGIVNDGEERLTMIFASAPLAPTPGQGHRETSVEQAPSEVAANPHPER
jgi:cyclase